MDDTSKKDADKDTDKDIDKDTSTVATNASTPGAVHVDASSRKDQQAFLKTKHLTDGPMYYPVDSVSSKIASVDVESQKATKDLTGGPSGLQKDSVSSNRASGMSPKKNADDKKSKTSFQGQKNRLQEAQRSREDTHPSIISPSQEAEQDDDDMTPGAVRVQGNMASTDLTDFQEDHRTMAAEDSTKDLNTTSEAKSTRMMLLEAQLVVEEDTKKVEQRVLEQIEEATPQRVLEEMGQVAKAEIVEDDGTNPRRRALICIGIIVTLLAIIAGAVFGTRDTSPNTTGAPTSDTSGDTSGDTSSDTISDTPRSNVLMGPDELSLATNGLGEFLTCAEFASFVETGYSENDCFVSQKDALDRNAVKCGCLESGQCPFCSDGSPPGNPDAFHSGGTQTCGELHELALYLPANQCIVNQVPFETQGFVCGCPGAEPACTLCFGSTSVRDPSSPALEGNGSCGDINNEVLRLTANECTTLQEALRANAIQCGCQHDVPWIGGAIDTAFVLEGTGSVTISCPNADDTCTLNGSFGAVSGSFNIGNGAFISRDGGSTSTFQEGNGSGSATIITCTDGCTCVLLDGSDCVVTSS
jgi:hypothetical protein